MRPFAGIDITENRKNEQPDLGNFITATASSSSRTALERTSDAAEAVIDDSKLPLPLRVLRVICGFAGGIIAVSIINVWAEDDTSSLIQVCQSVSWLFWLGAGCLVVWAVLKVLGIVRERNVLSDEEKTRSFTRLDTAMDAVYRELGVPDDAPAVDILVLTYKQKDGQPVPKTTGMNLTAWFNIENRAFVENDRLCLTDLESRFEFPLAELRRIRTVRKNISIPVWNKETAPDEDIYKPYKLSVDGYECIHFKPYHILELEHEGETWGIYFPCYELPVFEELTGLKAEA